MSGPRVAALVAADTEATQPYLVVEYVDGPTLADSVAKDGPLDGLRLRALAAALAEALVLIHEVGVIHRALKPTNVILAADQPKLVDFGIAAAAGSMPLTMAGTVIGSVAGGFKRRAGHIDEHWSARRGDRGRDDEIEGHVPVVGERDGRAESDPVRTDHDLGRRLVAVADAGEAKGQRDGRGARARQGEATAPVGPGEGAVVVGLEPVEPADRLDHRSGGIEATGDRPHDTGAGGRFGREEDLHHVEPGVGADVIQVGAVDEEVVVAGRLGHPAVVHGVLRHDPTADLGEIEAEDLAESVPVGRLVGDHVDWSERCEGERERPEGLLAPAERGHPLVVDERPHRNDATLRRCIRHGGSTWRASPTTSANSAAATTSGSPGGPSSVIAEPRRAVRMRAARDLG